MRRRRSRRNSNRRGMVCISAIVGVLLITLAFQSRKLEAKNILYTQQLAQVNDQLASEKERTQEIENMEEYMKTDEYVEDVARDKLGLVYEGETVFKPSN